MGNKKASWMLIGLAGLVVVAAAGMIGYALISEGGPGQPTVDDKTLEEAHQAAEHYIRKGEPANARTILEKLLEKHPDDPMGHELMGEALIALRETAEAREHIERAVELNPSRPDLRLLAGIFAEKSGELDRAEQHYARAASLAPGQAKYRMYLAQVMLRKNELGRAQMQLLKARELDSSLPQIHGMLGQIAARRGNLNVGLEQVEKAIEAAEEGSSNWVSFMAMKAQYLRRANKPQAALDVLRELPPEEQQKEEVVAHFAYTYMQMGEPEKAGAVWAELFSLKPDSARAAAEAGLCFVRAGAVDQAQRYLGLAERVGGQTHPKVRALKTAIQREREELSGVSAVD